MPITLNGTTGIAGVDGSAGTPAVQGGDSNTGMFFPAADTIAFAEGGTEVARFDSNGRLGIGTTSPISTLDVVGNVAATNYTATGADSTASQVILQSFRNGSGIQTGGAVRIRSVGDGTNDAVQMIFDTNSNEAMRIDSSGNLLVGDNAPVGGERLRVVGSNSNNIARFVNTSATPYGPLVQYTGATPNNTSSEFYQANDATLLRFAVRSNGGVANFSANNVNLSDERVKTDIAPLGSYWDKIKALEVVTYKYRDQTHEDNNIGVIAQQVESVAPEFISNDGFGETPEDGVPLKSVHEADLHYATLKALQEAMARIETLEARITALEAAQ